MAKANGARGMIAVDKMGTKVLFLDPVSYETEVVLDGFSPHRARAAGGAGDRPRLRADLRRRHPRPQSQSRPSALHHRPRQARPCRRHRSAALHRAAYAQARPGRPDLHHLREQRRGRGDRPRDPQGGGRHRFRLDQRPPPDHLARRPAALHRERGGRHGVGDRPADGASSCARSRPRARSPASRSRPTAAPWSRSTTSSRRCS